MEPTEPVCLTESVTKESAELSPVVQDQSVKRTKIGLKKYKYMVRKLKRRVNNETINPKIVKLKAAAVVMLLAKVSVRKKTDTGMVPRAAAGKMRIRCRRCCWLTNIHSL